MMDGGHISQNNETSGKVTLFFLVSVLSGPSSVLARSLLLLSRLPAKLAFPAWGCRKAATPVLPAFTDRTFHHAVKN
jgi:hypothetical protein